MKKMTSKEINQRNARWRAISQAAWRLAREAYESHVGVGTDPSEYIWNAIRNTNEFTEYEKGVLGEWACDDFEIIDATEKRKAAAEEQSPQEP